jgi:hypothetical protein
MSVIAGSSGSLGRNFQQARKFQQLRENCYNLEYELWANDNLQPHFLVVRCSIGVGLLMSNRHHSVDRVQTLRIALGGRKTTKTNMQEQISNNNKHVRHKDLSRGSTRHSGLSTSLLLRWPLRSESFSPPCLTQATTKVNLSSSLENKGNTNFLRFSHRSGALGRCLTD